MKNKIPFDYTVLLKLFNLLFTLGNEFFSAIKS